VLGSENNWCKQEPTGILLEGKGRGSGGQKIGTDLCLRHLRIFILRKPLKVSVFRVEAQNLLMIFFTFGIDIWYISFFFQFFSKKSLFATPFPPPPPALSPAGSHAGVISCFIPTYPVISDACSVYRVSQEERSVK
jgi:hypothetical protein